MSPVSPSKKGFLHNVHLYPKVPRDLTDGTRLGGLLSLACAGLMAYLLITNILSYLEMTTTSDVVLDDTGDVHMRLFFNVTMERLPCQFASVDLFDVMGTSLTNITGDITKFRVSPDAGHRQEFFVDLPHAVKHERMDTDEEDMWRALEKMDEMPKLEFVSIAARHARSLSHYTNLSAV
mmetsp:Transcript_79173/g.157411  ORF Transcript_79173/g.157411 Transcript_79173/m.157411 type:complete len:179 (-) Transcript_79173:1549-2085(-)